MPAEDEELRPDGIVRVKKDDLPHLFRPHSADDIDETMNNRNCRPVISLYDGFETWHLQKARAVFADRHGRLWAHYPDEGELRMIHDPEAARC